jgi:hypothetical protein
VQRRLYRHSDSNAFFVNNTRSPTRTDLSFLDLASDLIVQGLTLNITAACFTSNKSGAVTLELWELQMVVLID